MNYSKPTCSHPLFRYSSESIWHSAPPGISKPCVFVFERPYWRHATDEQIAEYRRNTEIVEKLGGRMIRQEWEIAGENPPISADEVRAIIEAVRRDNPDCTIIKHWNGEGCYTMSVGVDFGTA